MKSEREAIRQYVARIMNGRPVRWTDEQTSQGDFEGREWTLELFDVPRAERRQLNQRLWELRKRAWEELHVPLTLVFHTPEDTERLYSWVRKAEPALMVDSAAPSRARFRVQQLIGRRGRLDRDMRAA